MGAPYRAWSTVQVNASDNVGVTRVELYVDTVLRGTDTTAPYTWSWDSTTVANGNHTILAKAYDAAGNVGASPLVTVTVNNDTTPPSVPTLVAPVNGASVNTSTPTFDWSDLSDPSGLTYQVQVDNNTDFSSPQIDVSRLGTSAYTPGQTLSDSTYVWRVRAIH